MIRGVQALRGEPQGFSWAGAGGAPGSPKPSRKQLPGDPEVWHLSEALPLCSEVARCDSAPSLFEAKLPLRILETLDPDLSDFDWEIGCKTQTCSRHACEKRMPYFKGRLLTAKPQTEKQRQDKKAVQTARAR